MNFRREQLEDSYLLDTGVENIFVNEYMTSAPGDFVKVYLLARMYANLEQEAGNATIAKQLGLTEEDVLKAWSYWEDLGVIKKDRINPEDKFVYEVEFINLKERLYGKGAKGKKRTAEATAKDAMADKDIRDMYSAIERITGRVMNGAEMMEILTWINDFRASPEIIVYAYSYCKAKNKQNIRYVAAVVKGWVSEGLCDTAAVEEYLKDTDQKHYSYKRVCKALGFARNATEEEKKLMDSWFDDMGFTMDTVLEACGKTSGIPNPNMNYVNTILTNWHKKQGGGTAGGKPGQATAATVNQYYEYLRRTAEEEADRRREEVYGRVPRVGEIEEQMNICGMNISKMIISDQIDKKSQIERLQKQIDKYNREKAVLLTDNNFEMDYLEQHYKCDICKDTGITEEGERCECFQARTKEAELWQTNLK